MQKHWRQKETVRETPENGPSIINSQRSWQSKSTPDDENEAVLEPGMAVLAVSFITNPHQQSAAHRDAGTHRILFGSHSGSAIKDVFHVSSIVAIATTAAIVLLNCDSREPLYVLDFQVQTRY